jgi:hypothetical protein
MKTILATFLLAGTLTSAQAGWLDKLFKPAGTNQTAASVLTADEMTGGLKEALANGVQHAVRELGKPDGFLKNLDVKIPMPKKLQTVEKTLRTLKQDKMADDFVATLNRAAEQAVPEAADVFADSIRQMTVTDAKNILTGPNDSATQYFRKTSEEKLREKFRPIVTKATGAVGVTASYKNLLQQAGPAASLLGAEAGDLDGYITQKSLDGLFKMIAVEEKRIRENPVARTTDLLKKVFGGAIK